MSHPLSRLKLDYPLWVINWTSDAHESITARHLVSGQVLTARSIPELRALLSNPGLEDSDG